MLVEITKFGGLAPKFVDKQLGAEFARLATDVRFDRGRLEPWKVLGDSIATVPAGTKSLYRYNGVWLSDTDVVSYTPAPYVYNPFDYLVIAGKSYPRITRNDIATGTPPYPSVTYRLGIAAPLNPTVSRVPIAVTDADTVEGRRYIVCWVDAFGREGPPSPASIEVLKITNRDAGDTITVNRPALPSGGHNMGTGAKWRVYRSALTSDGRGIAQYVAELPVGTTSWVDDVAPEDGSEELQTTGWIGPADDTTTFYPDGPLKSVVLMPNGYLAGYAGYEVMFSERGTTHAWPVDYRKRLRYKITGIANLGGDIFVGTEGVPYLVTGADPSAMSEILIDDYQPCKSARSMVVDRGAVYYASPDGLCRYSGGRVEVVTAETISREYWQALNPASVHGYGYEGLYVGFYDTGTETGGFVLDLASGQFSKLSFYATAGHYDIATDSLYLVVAGNIRKFAGGSANSSFEWESGSITLPYPINFTCVAVNAIAYPTTVNVTATLLNGSTRTFSKVLSSPDAVLMPAGFQAIDWRVRVYGTNDVLAVALATSISEVKW